MHGGKRHNDILTMKSSPPYTVGHNLALIVGRPSTYLEKSFKTNKAAMQFVKTLKGCEQTLSIQISIPAKAGNGFQAEEIYFERERSGYPGKWVKTVF